MRNFWVCLLVCCTLMCSLALSGSAFAASRQAPAQKNDQKNGQKSGQKAEQKTGQPQAAKPAPSAAARSVPTRITADGMTYEADAQQVTFTNNVHVVRPDFEMWANKITVYLKPAKKKEATEDSAASVTDSLAAGDIDRIVATGSVRMKRDKNTSTSDKATYTMDTALLVLEGNPRLTDGENVITGEVVRYFMNENRSDVLSGPKRRVEAVFTTSDKPTREGGR